jgi:hypothetical protein
VNAVTVASTVGKLEATAKATAIRAQGGVTVRLWPVTSLHPTDALPR